MAASLPSQTSSLSKNEKQERHENVKEVEKIYQRYREVISTLPKEKGWLSEHLHLYQGFWYHPMYGLEGTMFVQQHFVARPTDVLLISSPKSGTTWLKAIIFAIMKRKTYNSSSTHPLLTTTPHQCVPFLELMLFRVPPIADVESLPSPRLFATHIPYASLPESILSSGCQMVYVCRNPKDVLVSMWHFLATLRAKELQLPPLSLKEAFELFSRGISAYGPFWDHIQGYKKASQELPQRVLFVTYESMKREPLVHIKRLAEFLGQPFSAEEESDGIVQEILELCSFERLSNLKVNKTGTFRAGVQNSVFFREGKVGDWKNHLTTHMIESLDQITLERLDGIF